MITINSKPYEILTCYNLDALQEEVNAARKIGYEVSGSPTVMHTHITPRDGLYSQAMVLKDRDKFEAWVAQEKEKQAKELKEKQRIDKEQRAKDKALMDFWKLWKNHMGKFIQVRVKKFDKRPKEFAQDGSMDKYMGKKVRVRVQNDLAANQWRLPYSTSIYFQLPVSTSPHETQGYWRLNAQHVELLGKLAKVPTSLKM